MTERLDPERSRIEPVPARHLATRPGTVPGIPCPRCGWRHAEVLAVQASGTRVLRCLWCGWDFLAGGGG